MLYELLRLKGVGKNLTVFLYFFQMCSFLSELLSCLTIKKIASILNGLEELENHLHN